MSADERHEEILQCILETLQAGTNDAYLSDEIFIEDYDENQMPSFGIAIQPVGDNEQIGTNERDDIDYITQITRVVHSLGEDDRTEKSRFRSNIRQLFHRKRIDCVSDCHLYSRVEFGGFSIPRAWTAENNSISAVRIYTLVRESR